MFQVNKQELEEIVSRTVSKVLLEMGAVFWHGDDFEVKFLNREEILSVADQLWNISEGSYRNIGGLRTYKDKTNFIGMARYAKVVYDGEDIVACGIYRRIEGSYKLVAIGCEQTERGKTAIQVLVKDDIAKVDMHFWAEVSGAIEHYFKKHNGYPMPNTLAPLILGMDSSVIELSDKDNVHYWRKIGGERFEKMIFGIKNEEIFNAVLKEVDDYSSFMRSVNNLNESENNTEGYSVKQAVYIIENIYRAHEEDGFNELVPAWHDAIRKSLKTLYSAEKNNTVEDYIEYGEYILNSMPLLELKQLNLKHLPCQGNYISNTGA